MRVKKEEMKYVAQLAKLEFNEEEEKEVIEELDRMFKYMENLNELNTDGVNITINPYCMENKFREDTVEESMDIKEILDNSPQNLKEYIVVPQVIE
jgi:aspartyl-tRNA(Asn)/glutamyl-tRNA(Gln) amidotransferase subunit C